MGSFGALFHSASATHTATEKTALPSGTKDH
jgi:hypothetical protein